MGEKVPVQHGKMRLIVDDLTALDIEAFVFYANHDLKLGSGHGSAISMRGGPSIQEELSKLDPLETTQAIISSAGELKAKHIIHSVGPRFREEGLEEKLKQTIINAMKLADEKGIKALAIPAMGAGFFGVPLDICADIMIKTINEYLSGDTQLDEVVICALDNHEFIAFEPKISALS